MPGQTLALEDFDVVRLDEEGAGVVLVLSRGAADVKGVHWITGASEVDLLQSYPLPHDVYENMSAGVSMYLVNLYSFVFELR
ncbi:unnamed protein product [Phytomonas sp. EM1]|nr:unnamed protein product [Phytomonas sp. EM1]|eukprot:CCW64670.1 unnamed protein product [Phytomonas sp. isolate EM1]